MIEEVKIKPTDEKLLREFVEKYDGKLPLSDFVEEIKDVIEVDSYETLKKYIVEKPGAMTIIGIERDDDADDADDDDDADDVEFTITDGSKVKPQIFERVDDVSPHQKLISTYVQEAHVKQDEPLLVRALKASKYINVGYHYVGKLVRERSSETALTLRVLNNEGRWTKYGLNSFAIAGNGRLKGAILAMRTLSEFGKSISREKEITDLCRTPLYFDGTPYPYIGLDISSFSVIVHVGVDVFKGGEDIHMLSPDKAYYPVLKTTPGVIKGDYKITTLVEPDLTVKVQDLPKSHYLKGWSLPDITCLHNIAHIIGTLNGLFGSMLHRHKTLGGKLDMDALNIIGTDQFMTLICKYLMTPEFIGYQELFWYDEMPDLNPYDTVDEYTSFYNDWADKIFPKPVLHRTSGTLAEILAKLEKTALDRGMEVTAPDGRFLTDGTNWITFWASMIKKVHTDLYESTKSKSTPSSKSTVKETSSPKIEKTDTWTTYEDTVYEDKEAEVKITEKKELKMKKYESLVEYLETYDCIDLANDILEYRKKYDVVNVTEDGVMTPKEGIPQAVADRVQRNLPTLFEDQTGGKLLKSVIFEILQGRNVLLQGEKASGKNILANTLAYIFRRPIYDMSINGETSVYELIGGDTFKEGEVQFRPSHVYNVGQYGGLCVLDEINMARAEVLASLHIMLDTRKAIDVPGYGRLQCHKGTIFIGTMNYGYAGTSELNEALTSRFTIFKVDPLMDGMLESFLRLKSPNSSATLIRQIVQLNDALREKVKVGEITTRSIDIRAFTTALSMIEGGIDRKYAFECALVNKEFEETQRQIVRDAVETCIDLNI